MSSELTHELAMAVKVLCDLRLACTVLMVLAVPSLGLGGEVIGVIGASLAMSYLLLRHWDPLGARLMQGWVLPALESLVAVLLFVDYGNSGLGGAYLGASLALLACTGGVRAMMISLGAFVPIVVLGALGFFPTLGGGSVKESIWLFSVVVLQVACSLGGYYLRTMLVSRVELLAQRRTAEVTQASSQERLRLAHELHDGVSKTLHGCHMIAESLARQLAREEHPEAMKARQLTHSLEVARQESRDLLLELRQVPPADLLPYVRKVLSQWARENPEIAVVDELPSEPMVVALRVRHEVLRVLGELLENARRHAATPSVVVRLSRDGDGAALTVTDAGVGLPSKARLDAMQGEGHFGLAGVRERMDFINGSYRIDSGGNGTRVEVGFPLVGAEEGNTP